MMPRPARETANGLRILPVWPVAEHLRPDLRDDAFNADNLYECPLYTLMAKPRGWTSTDPTCGRFFDLTAFLSLDDSISLPFVGEA